MDDISLFYYGGSGGFCALWTILLGTDYRCAFRHNRDLDGAFNHTWNIKNVSTWKETEVWPQNTKTSQSDIDKKLFFYCNPHKEAWDQAVGFKIVLYTDIYTQMYFAYKKNAYWFNDHPLDYYRDEFKELDHNNISSEEFLHRLSHTLGSPIKYNGMEVHSKLLNEIDINDADCAVTLQSLINTQGSSILKPLGVDTNDKCVSFLEHYKSLYTDDMMKHLLTENRNADPY